MEVGSYSPGASYSIVHKLVASFSPQLEIYRETAQYQGPPQYEPITQFVPFIYQEAVMQGHHLFIQRQSNGKHTFTIRERAPGAGAGHHRSMMMLNRRDPTTTTAEKKAIRRTPITDSEKLLSSRRFSPSRP